MAIHSIQSETSSRGARMLRSALGSAIAGYLEDEAIIEV
ncbi:P-type conjugative transfer ATPase TrbB, partial [Bradyrhizobium sp. WBAH23]|nr:P-type conjugative transfer ATPase TrbB [Bradyrhizobium sp. WBAH30]MDD1547765.1 P-type conjugative transfer ATPase TrbB [Bradyrhizobium sp. WBAH41]MDD1561418.1 P-type conjugative transfer ATPase TrbB [Bradyrhizobium sp. WBAH23]MDD1568858.1 P-type conjugative transfer ATPase TrbB [Bradyrhizobium sp. WBAH33]MDD1594822.1 P-type conjugative transfer ATPase TrbB [Bradyrhizobium sp. WBAH42]NRB92373.1 P-type conjugative transfer ATPase TrbB [Bradyrhizobium sp. WBAH10]